MGRIYNSYMKKEFTMSIIGELNFFIGVQIKQEKKGIFLNQSKYAKELVRKFGIKTSMV